jgi:hypothetical protein
VENEGKVALIYRALYRGKSAGRDFRNPLRSCMHHIGFKSCPADPDVWMRSAIKSVFFWTLMTPSLLELKLLVNPEERDWKVFRAQGEVDWTSQVVPWRPSESG